MRNGFIDTVKRVMRSDSGVDLSPLYETPLGKALALMEETPQDTRYHREGNVLRHTVCVLNELLCSEDYHAESEEGKTVLFLAALLHDIGKPECTRICGDEITARRHSIVGAKLARRLLWQELGLSGEGEAQRLREAVCLLIRYHSYPPFCISDEGDARLHKIAANGMLTNAFSLRRLITLEKADSLGRRGEGTAEMLDRVKYCELLAEELGILDTPYTFTSDYARRAYFKGRLSYRGDTLYKPEPFEVILMSGLPGTGKDTYIRRRFPDLPVISLDAIREELKISPTENQTRVIEKAHGDARALLRKKQAFVWNATSITAELRSMQISLFEEYGAFVRCVFLETGWEENLRRNGERDRNVPVDVIEKMLSRLEPPEAYECETVEWLTL